MDEGLSATGRRLVGYALRWGQPAFIGGSRPFEERFRRGAFARSIMGGKVTMCLDHDRAAVVARQSDGTLTLIEDEVGLRVDAWALGTPAGDDALDSARCRYRAGLSVGFNDPVADWTDGVRIVRDCRLVEISVVRDPAYRSSELFAGRMRISAFEARLPVEHHDDRMQQLLEREAALAARIARQ